MYAHTWHWPDFFGDDCVDPGARSPYTFTVCVCRAETHTSNDHLPESCSWMEGILSKFVLRPGSIEPGHLSIRSVSLEFADFSHQIFVSQRVL